MENDSANKILKELNYARENPKEYADKLLSYKQYFKGDIMRIPGQTAIKTNEGFAAFEEAAKILQNSSPLCALSFNVHLNEIANEALSSIVKSNDADAANNINIDELIGKRGQIAGQFSQAVDFGSATPDLVVVNLIVDDGDLNRGNRGNILNPKFTITGIAHSTHKTFHHCTVITYARHFIPTGEDPGNLSDDCYERVEKKTEDVVNKQEFIAKEVPPKKEEYKTRTEPKLDTQQELQIPKFVYVKTEKGEDFNLPNGVEKIERQEKIIVEDGKKRKCVKEKRFFKDGTVETDIYKLDF